MATNGDDYFGENTGYSVERKEKELGLGESGKPPWWKRILSKQLTVRIHQEKRGREQVHPAGVGGTEAPAATERQKNCP